jgi:hypothetical protein
MIFEFIYTVIAILGILFLSFILILITVGIFIYFDYLEEHKKRSQDSE